MKKKKKQLAENIESNLPDQIKRAVILAKEKGASSWLTVLPIEQHGYNLPKSSFRDCICLRYGWNQNISQRNDPVMLTSLLITLFHVRNEVFPLFDTTKLETFWVAFLVQSAETLHSNQLYSH